MENVYFKSVTVESAYPGKLQNISSVGTAVEFLLNEWPAKRGKLHGLARQACLEALDGTVTGDMARSAFLEAATEANIYVENTSWVHY